jgi:hypothetical protein
MYIFHFITVYVIIFFLDNVHTSPVKSVVLSKPGTLYNGHAYVESQDPTSNHRGSTSMPVLRLPPNLRSAEQNSGGYNNNNNYQPAEFTLATFASDKSVSIPGSRGSIASGSEKSITSGSQGRARTVPKHLQKV